MYGVVIALSGRHNRRARGDGQVSVVWLPDSCSDLKVMLRDRGVVERAGFGLLQLGRATAPTIHPSVAAAAATAAAERNKPPIVFSTTFGIRPVTGTDALPQRRPRCVFAPTCTDR